MVTDAANETCGLHFFTHSWKRKRKKKNTYSPEKVGLTCRWKAAPGLDT